MPIPSINYESNDFYFLSVQAGYYLWKEPQNQLSLTMLGAPQNFDTGRTSDKQLKKLNNRHMTLMAGVNYQRVTDWGIVRTTLAGDTLGNSKGYQWDIGWLYRFQMGRFGVMPDGA